MRWVDFFIYIQNIKEFSLILGSNKNACFWVLVDTLQFVIMNVALNTELKGNWWLRFLFPYFVFSLQLSLYWLLWANWIILELTRKAKAPKLMKIFIIIKVILFRLKIFRNIVSSSMRKRKLKCLNTSIFSPLSYK